MKAIVLSAELSLKRGCEGRTAPANAMWRDPWLAIRDVPEPAVEADDDVILEVLVCGICGSDTHASEAGPDGYVKFSGPARLPVVMGHEFVGRVIACGRGVALLREGELVAAESVQACLSCATCAEGHLNQCERLELLGLTVHGALARCVKVKAHHCYSVEPILRRFGHEEGVRVGSLLEPLGCAFNGLFVGRGGGRIEGVTPSDRVAVFGAGPIGLGAVMLARTARASRIVSFDLSDERASLALRAGADAAFNVARLARGRRSLREVADEVTGGDGFTVIVEAAGAPGLFAEALSLLSARGRLVYLGRTPSPESFDPNLLVSKAAWVNGSRGHAGYGIFPALIDMVADGRLDPRPLITAQFDFADALQAFAQARRQRDGKVLVRVNT